MLNNKGIHLIQFIYYFFENFRRPNEALLSINCFQKDLSDSNPLVRAWALRAMAGIRLHVIAPIVLVAVGKCARDPSVYVRKCAANALPKLYDLHQEENASTLEEVSLLLIHTHTHVSKQMKHVAFLKECEIPPGLLLWCMQDAHVGGVRQTI